MCSVQPPPVYYNPNQSNNIILWHLKKHIQSYMTTISSFYAEHKYFTRLCFLAYTSTSEGSRYSVENTKTQKNCKLLLTSRMGVDALCWTYTDRDKI